MRERVLRMEGGRAVACDWPVGPGERGSVGVGGVRVAGRLRPSRSAGVSDSETPREPVAADSHARWLADEKKEGGREGGMIE